MKVLLSAYACEPGKGSEPLVGWRWAQELAKLGISVWVLTRRNNRAVIEASLAHQPMPGVQIAAFFVARSARRQS